MNKTSHHPKTCGHLFRALVAATLAIVTVAAFAQGKGETITIQDYPGTIGLTMRVAIAKGYCADAGITCKLQVIPSAPLGIQAMLAKSIDAAIGSPEAIIPAVLRGAKVTWILDDYAKGVGVVLVGNQVPTPNAGKPFPEWVQDMKGKKIGVTSRGSGNETQVRFILEKAGVKADDVTFVAVGGPTTAIPALVHKQIDFAASFEPGATMCEVTKQCKVAWRADANRQPAEIYAANLAGDGLYLTQEYADAHPDVVAALIKAAHEANKFINDPANFEEVVKISESFFKFSGPDGDELTRALLRRQIKTGGHNEHVDRAAVKATVEYMIETGEIGKAINVSELVDQLVYSHAP
ncbi:MAG: ABC transporter substrate-binding protein [Burkholderiaceae bacterium]|nr:MAG: ABC transporter substrate-binding protein [Burkholderiaceae bacterium]